MPDESSRKIIAALQVSLDGLIEGPDGEIDWIGSWEDTFDLLSEIDACPWWRHVPGLRGGLARCPGEPTGVQPLTGQIPTEGEVEYARFADRTPHYVLSRTLDKVALRTARIVRDVAEIRTLKRLPGKHIHAVGGASLVSTLMNEGLVESASSRRAPTVLGQGKPLFENVEQRHALELIENTRLPGDRVSWLDRRRRSGARLQVH